MFPPFVRHLHGRQGGQVQRRRSCNDLPFAIDQFFEVLDPAGRVCDDEAIVQPYQFAFRDGDALEEGTVPAHPAPHRGRSFGKAASRPHFAQGDILVVLHGRQLMMQ
jgi:hypothetical protein